jgi:hypothetical protein
MKRKYLVSVPVMARVEVYVDAESEEEAKEKAWLEADENKEKINSETIEVISYNDKISKIEGELFEFAISEGYYVFDCKKEFGEDFE